MANKDKGGKHKKQPPAHTLKEKREAKREKESEKRRGASRL